MKTILSTLLLFVASLGLAQENMSSLNYSVRNDMFVSAGGTLQSDTLSVSGKFGTAHLGRMESARFKIGTFVQLPEVTHETVPQEFELGQNYPNPFNQSTTIAYSLPTTSDVELTVYSILGRHIGTLVQEKQAAGRYRLKFNGTDADGLPLPSGVYLLSLKTKGFDKMIKIAILR